MPLITLRVAGVRPETPRNRLVRLALDGRPFPFLAGQHVLLGDHDQPDRRPYSIANAPVHVSRDGVLEFLIQVGPDESPGPHLRQLRPGGVIDVEGPAGDFTLPPVGTLPYLFVAGGTGISPLRSMAWQVLETQPGARVALVQSARTPGELAFTDELRGAAAAGRLRLLETITRGAGETGWAGARGRLDAELLAPLFSPDALCFVCGPDSLVEDVPRLLAAMGARTVRTEHWADARP